MKTKEQVIFIMIWVTVYLENSILLINVNTFMYWIGARWTSLPDWATETPIVLVCSEYPRKHYAQIYTKMR